MLGWTRNWQQLKLKGWSGDSGGVRVQGMRVSETFRTQSVICQRTIWDLLHSPWDGAKFHNRIRGQPTLSTSSPGGQTRSSNWSQELYWDRLLLCIAIIPFLPCKWPCQHCSKFLHQAFSGVLLSWCHWLAVVFCHLEIYIVDVLAIMIEHL